MELETPPSLRRLWRFSQLRHLKHDLQPSAAACGAVAESIDLSQPHSTCRLGCLPHESLLECFRFRTAERWLHVAVPPELSAASIVALTMLMAATQPMTSTDAIWHSRLAYISCLSRSRAATARGGAAGAVGRVNGGARNVHGQPRRISVCRTASHGAGLGARRHPERLPLQLPVRSGGRFRVGGHQRRRRAAGRCAGEFVCTVPLPIFFQYVNLLENEHNVYSQKTIRAPTPPATCPARQWSPAGRSSTPWGTLRGSARVYTLRLCKA